MKIYNKVLYPNDITNKNYVDNQDKILDTKIDEKIAEVKSTHVELTQAEYDALGSEKYSDDKEYFITDAEPDSPTIIYGWHVDPDESSPSDAVTYLKDAIGMTPAAMGSTAFNYGSWADAFFMPRPCMVRSNGTVDYYLNPNDYTKKVDGTASDIANLDYDGNAMMEWGLIWWKYEAGTAEGEGYFYVSNHRVDSSYKCWCNYDSKNNITDHFYTAIYNGTSAPTFSTASTYAVNDHVTYNNAEYKCITAIETAGVWDSSKWEQVSATTRLRSLSGIALTAANGNGSTTGQTEINRATANNTTVDTEWYIDVWSDRMLINGLLILMGKSLDSQGVFGRGIDTGSQASKEAYVTGTLNDKGLFYGSTANGTTAVKVFGMENWWALVWHRTAGLVGLSNGTTAVKMTYGTADGTTADGYNTTGTGYYIDTNVRPASGYMAKARFNALGYYLPSVTTGGSATTRYCDYWYTNNAATTFALVGGSSGGGVACGSSCFNLGSAVGSAAWSFAAAPSLKPLAQKG